MKERIDPHLHILLDLQKQLGTLSVETAKQTEKLNSIEKQTIKTNGRVSTLETINETNANTQAVKKGKNIVWALIGGFVGSVILALFIGFLKDILNQ